ncbi:alkene reductase [Salinibius halmophilus]|uniref:alkene reductase n=1 Tax=Salinibius halmophilus TaxID=1853216 RepID=UPI0018F5CE5E|nr:alkene reductase [Salinibius halmophilus]
MKAFTSVQYGDITATNRFVMAPMTRCRATENGLATPIMATYYAQRASAGLIISEGIYLSIAGKGFSTTPGLHSLEQVKSWQPVTAAVHEQGGKIFAQIMHAGRIGHPSINGQQPLAPSAIAANGEIFTPSGKQPYPQPLAMDAQAIQTAIDEHVTAAINAIDAGFDGIEIHAGNGFLIHQFMASNTNVRTDDYGGSVANRVRFAVEVIKACGQAIGFGKVGVRLSPQNAYNDIIEEDTNELYKTLIEQLPTELAYLHVMEANCRHHTQAIRALWQGPLIVNPHSDANAWPASTDILPVMLDTGLTDGVCFGALFVANPDLVARVKNQAPLNEMKGEYLYEGGEVGYTDYPLLAEALA